MIRGLLFTLAAVAMPLVAQARAPAIAAAIAHDPPTDAAHPASGRGVQFLSHGELINAQLYRPGGVGPHPTIVLFHGLPGNEQNLDLARVLQRAGYTVITFHYRGAWGSAGAFTLRGGVEDAKALLAELRRPARAREWGVDPAHILLVGHSYGGYVAARAAAEDPGVRGLVLIAPWDIAFDARAWARLDPAARAAKAPQVFDDVDGRLAGSNARTLMDEITQSGAELDLGKLAPALAGRPLLVVTATRDDPDDQARDLLPALRAQRAARLTAQVMPTDHGFNDHRIALEAAVLAWLARQDGPAPSSATRRSR